MYDGQRARLRRRHSPAVGARSDPFSRFAPFSPADVADATPAGGHGLVSSPVPRPLRRCHLSNRSASVSSRRQAARVLLFAVTLALTGIVALPANALSPQEDLAAK